MNWFVLVKEVINVVKVGKYIIVLYPFTDLEYINYWKQHQKVKSAFCCHLELNGEYKHLVYLEMLNAILATVFASTGPYLTILEIHLQNLNCKVTSSGIQLESTIITSLCFKWENLHIVFKAFSQDVQTLLKICLDQTDSGSP